MTDNNKKQSYYQKNRDALLKELKIIMKIINKKRKEYQRNRFHNMNIEQINYLNEYRKATYSKLDIEKKNKIRKDARDKYHLVKAY